jgi:two-component system, LuxR family, sensor kinase FixL
LFMQDEKTKIRGISLFQVLLAWQLLLILSIGLILRIADYLNAKLEVASAAGGFYNGLSHSPAEAVLILFLILVLVSLSAMFISRSISLPLMKISEYLVQISEGNFLSRINLKSYKEIKYLSRTFNMLAEKLSKNFVFREELNRETAERKRIENAFFENEVLNRTLFESAGDGILIICNGSIVDCNKRLLEILGYQRQDIIAQPLYAYSPLTQPDGSLSEEKAKSNITQVMNNGPLSFEWVYKDSNDRDIYTEINLSRLGAANKMMLQAVVRDISQRKTQEEMLLSYASRVQEASRELDDFTYIVSHDLKEPLRSINAFAKFIEQDYGQNLDLKGLQYISRIKANADYMHELIADLLEISRIEKKGGRKEVADINSIIEEVKLRFEYLIKEKKVILEIKDKMPQMYCDRLMIAEVFANLISNAIKFNNKTEPRIEVGYALKGPCHHFYVKDNGPGIEEKYFEKIFLIFQRLVRKEDYEGTGAGLTIAKKIVEMHGGRIWVESMLGQYSRFCFFIPAAKEMVLSRKKLGEILVEKNLVTPIQVNLALQEQLDSGIVQGDSA